ncbi:unnamed protein product, partial [Durusdinium trenchii]
QGHCAGPVLPGPTTLFQKDHMIPPARALSLGRTKTQLRTLNARFSMNCSVEPKQLNIQVIPTSGTVPPMIPYIFKFADDGSLYLSGPADSSMRRATSFGG